MKNNTKADYVISFIKNVIVSLSKVNIFLIHILILWTALLLALVMKNYLN